MEYEVVDKQGNKRWISEQEAISKGLIKEPKKDTLLQKVNKTWLGSVIGTPATIGSSVMTTPTLSVLDKKNKASLDKARELTAMAKNELDANKRKELLNEARSIMETSGQRTEKSVNALNQGNVYSGLDRETPNTFKEQLNTYAPQGAKTASDIMDLILLGGGYGASGNSLKKILSSGAIGASRGAISETGSKPTGELSDVNAGDVAGSAALQGLLGMLFTAGAEGINKRKEIMESLNLFKKWGNAASNAAEGKPFDAKQLEKTLKISAEKLSGKDRRVFLKLLEEEAISPIANNAKVALDVRRNLKPASFLKKVLFGESVSEKFKVAKYSAINEQLKKIPELVKYDKYISTLSKIIKVGKPIIYAKVIDKIIGNKGSQMIENIF
jgi:hypothetical protein